MSKKKSIASSFGNLTQQATTPPTDKQTKPATAHTRVAAGVIGATQRSLTEIREERDRLLAAAEKGGQIITLDPSDIDPSPFRDRLPDDDPREFERFKSALAKEGQRTPISVRRNPTNEHRYQIVFGHRRWRALSELGQKVEARLGDFSDRDLVVAQGMENAERQDLSFIERALFCEEMANAGIKPKDIKAALGVDDAQMSKFRAVTRALPKPILEKIGRAPNIGRPRWLELAAEINSDEKLSLLEQTLSDDKVLALKSDDRFSTCLATIKGTSKPEKQKPNMEKLKFSNVGEVAFGKSDVRIKVKKQHAEAFKSFMQRNLPEIEAQFMREVLGQKND